jgi:hypothetical protein
MKSQVRSERQLIFVEGQIKVRLNELVMLLNERYKDQKVTFCLYRNIFQHGKEVFLGFHKTGQGYDKALNGFIYW